MPLNERDVTAATAAEVRRAGPITPRALRRAVAARLGLNTKDEAVLFEKYAGRLKDAAAASNGHSGRGGWRAQGRHQTRTRRDPNQETTCQPRLAPAQRSQSARWC